jgi:hypothetical protein
MPTTCGHCGEEFPNRSGYDHHYKAVHHKSEERGHFPSLIKADRGAVDGKFHCVCRKPFVREDKLIAHQKKCQEFLNFPGSSSSSGQCFSYLY